MLAIPEPDRKWFVLLIEPQMERKAAAHLIGRRLKAYLPEETVIATRGLRRRKVPIRRPLFRGYLFIKLAACDDGYGRALSVPGVHKFLMFDNQLATVPEPVMQRIFDIEQILIKPPELKGPSAIFRKGEPVRVGEGPFTGFGAEILTLDDAERITILLPFFGRETKIQLFAEQLEKL